MSFTEDNYKRTLTALFEQIGYTYICFPNIKRDYDVLFYEEQLTESLNNVS